MTTAERFSSYILPTYGRFPIVPTKARGSYLWDENGKEYLDFCTGIAVCSLGHCHPALTQAIQEQAATLMHCSNLYEIPQQGELAEMIVEEFVELPGKIFFSNSGAEANDGLIKLARRFGLNTPDQDGEPRFEMITCQSSFHGRTLGAMSATAQPKIHEGFEPLLPGFRYAEFNQLESVKAQITAKTAAILIEPVQGEGGVHVATAEFLRGLKALCEEKNLLLFFDEVQCGFGRTGDLMGWRSIAPEVEPDGISWAKGMGGGFPIGCFWVNDRLTGTGNKQKSLSGLLSPGSHGSTYGGNPLACAAALAVLREIKGSKLPSQARALSSEIQKEITSWNHPSIEGVRGLGLLLGIGIRPDTLTLPEGCTAALFITKEALKEGLLLVPAGADTVRLLPPLTVSREEIAQALQILRKVLDSAQK